MGTSKTSDDTGPFGSIYNAPAEKAFGLQLFAKEPRTKEAAVQTAYFVRGS